MVRLVHEVYGLSLRNVISPAKDLDQLWILKWQKVISPGYPGQVEA